MNGDADENRSNAMLSGPQVSEISNKNILKILVGDSTILKIKVSKYSGSWMRQVKKGQAQQGSPPFKSIVLLGILPVNAPTVLRLAHEKQ